MITREDAFNKKALMLSTQLNFDRVLNEIYDSFEQHIKELEEQYDNLHIQYVEATNPFEPQLLSNTELLNCDGCKYNKINLWSVCGGCSRKAIDKYEKDHK